MSQMLQMLSIISFVGAGISLVVSAFFWFFFKIPKVIGDLSGRTARKSIAKMRIANEKNGVKTYKTSKVNVERGKVTGSIPGSDELKKKLSVTEEVETETVLLENNRAKRVDVVETAALNEETEELNSEPTSLLVEDEVHASDAVAYDLSNCQTGNKFEIIEEIMFIHTDEVIE